MRIGIINYPTFGGSGIVGTELGLELQKRGHEIHFISYQLPERLKLEEKFTFHEVNILSYPLFKYKPYTIILAAKIVELFKKYKIDLFHGHYAIPHSTSLYLAKQTNNRIKIVSTLHGSDIHLLGLDKAYKPILETSLNNHDALTTVSNFMVRFIKKHYNITKEIKTIYNFVSPEKFNAKKRKKKTEQEEFVFSHVSNFRQVKRSPDIIRAFALVYKKHKNIKLEMVGSGPELEYCRDLAISLGLKDQIVFRGSLLNVPKVLCETDVFIIPSEIESFGLAALEALSCGIPVIASTAGGLPEVVKHEKTGFTAEPGNVKQLAQYMTILLEDNNLRQKFSEAAIKDARERFHPDKIISQYEKLYEDLLKK
ncbi:MAG: N-acetyl-alpha-D-glucosaminyl L-malate synthase BshA [Candidatus Heimdallarchaeota archaeon]|nr:MAG: N-acetyl-alpha-D-glucosaminyl L-malate synthase BshA [Candidatus Gerdarchaeota archaeon]RLI71072.1 MAG: N-acetyl-alpha-D-glucosaminyl L-malate synthase BshA [Candidatus Heimdallarchaeota archaeon]RLI71853.1 MAG: N-acetyl-alpha-D-glucosaminyl L-malate synthase BshA [Candidatus Gerdarchaeota archaeon]